MFTPVGSLLKTLPRRSKIPDAMVALFVRRAFEKTLKAVCADLSFEILAKVSAGSFKNGVLTVNAPPMTTGELSMRSGGLLRDINERLGRKVVNKIRFRVG